MTKPYLYCLMEVGARELLARCLVSCIAAERGFTVLLGHQYTLLEHATVFPAGIYFSKGTNAISTTNMKLARDNGHINVACEEENFFRVLRDNPVVCSDEGLPDVCNAFLAMGKEEADIMSERFGSALPLYQCGNARTDILRPEFRSLYAGEVEDLKRLYGDYILVNSNLGIINSPAENSSVDDVFRSWCDSEIFDPALNEQDRINVFEDFVDFEHGNARALRGILSELSRTTNKVIFRPHPGEHQETWNEFLTSLGAENIEMVPWGSHIPLILGARLVVHTSCTTGVEALLLNIPTLSMVTTDASANDYYLSNRFNVTCTQVEDAMHLIEKTMAGDTAISDARKDLLGGMADYLDALEFGRLAAEQIVDVFADIVQTQSGSVVNTSAPRQKDPYILSDSKDYTGNPYIKQKFGVSQELVHKTIMDFRKVFGRFSDINLHQISETVWKLAK